MSEMMLVGRDVSMRLWGYVGRNVDGCRVPAIPAEHSGISLPAMGAERSATQEEPMNPFFPILGTFLGLVLFWAILILCQIIAHA